MNAKDFAQEFSNYISKDETYAVKLIEGDVYGFILELSEDSHVREMCTLWVWLIWYCRKVFEIDILKDKKIVELINEGKLSNWPKNTIEYDELEINLDTLNSNSLSISGYWREKNIIKKLILNPDDGVISNALSIPADVIIFKNTIKELSGYIKLNIGSTGYYDGTLEDFLSIKMDNDIFTLNAFTDFYFNYNGTWINSIKEINLENVAFKNLWGIKAFLKSVEKIILPKNLAVLPKETIRNFENLKEVSMPKSLKKIEAYNFYNCPKLKINLPELNINNNSMWGDCFHACDEIYIENLIYQVTGEQDYTGGSLTNNKQTVINNLLILNNEVVSRDKWSQHIANNNLAGAVINNLFINWDTDLKPKLSQLLYCKKIGNIKINPSSGVMKIIDGIAYAYDENNKLKPFAVSSEASKEKDPIPTDISDVYSASILDLMLPDMSKYTRITRFTRFGHSYSPLTNLFANINSKNDVVILPPNLESFADTTFQNVNSSQIRILKFGNKIKEIEHKAFKGSTIEQVEIPSDADPVIFADSFTGFKGMVNYKGQLIKPSQVYPTYKNKLTNNAQDIELFRISGYYNGVFARSSSRAPAGMLAVSIKSNQGAQASDAPVYFRTIEDAEDFARNFANATGRNITSLIHDAKLSSKDLSSGFSEFNTPYGKVLIQNWRNIRYAKEDLNNMNNMNENLEEAFEPWKADAWLAGTRKENVARMSAENMMAYNNYLDNVAYQALRANDRVKAMKCVNLMRQLYMAANNRDFNDTADRINQIINHRRSEISTLDRNRELNGQPVRRGLFNPEPADESLNEDLIVIEQSEAKEKLNNIINQIKNEKNEDTKKSLLNLLNIYLYQTYKPSDRKDSNITDAEWVEFNKFYKQQTNKDLNEEVEIHDTLNPIIWNEDNTLKPEVAEKAKEVAQTFVNILTENGIKIRVIDIYLVGSNANYNYNESSDIDIHIIADDSFDCDKRHLPLLYDAYKSLFNKKYDISFKGINVEVYVETGEPSVSGGIYSIKDNKWIKEPDKNDIPEIDQEAVGQGLNEWIKRYEEITASPDIEEIDEYIDDLYNLRINSIANEGEFGTGNLIFKEVRRNGILDKLKELKIELEENELSLESLKEELLINNIMNDNLIP